MKPGIKTSEFASVGIGVVIVTALLSAETMFGFQLDENTKLAVLGSLGVSGTYVAARSWLKGRAGVVDGGGFKTTEFAQVIIAAALSASLPVLEQKFNFKLDDTTRNLILGFFATQVAYIIGRKFVKMQANTTNSSLVPPVDAENKDNN